MTATQVIGAFMGRAGRILSTDAARREDVATLGSTMKIVGRIGEPPTRLDRFHLPESELLAAAAVIRPVTLAEPVNLWRVSNVIGELLGQTVSTTAQREFWALKEKLQTELPSPRWEINIAHGEGVTRLTNVEIAELYLNAHVWHDDLDKQFLLRHISEDECRVSATVWVSDRILAVRALQQVIVDHGLA